MNSFEFNKIAGAILVTALVALTAVIISEGLVPEAHVAASHAARGPHGGEAEAETDSAAEEPAGPTLAALLPAADAGAGQAGAKKCVACHTFDQGGANRVGPNLHGIVGRPKGSYPGYSYSGALKEAGGNWTYEDLSAYLLSPRGFIKGTKMSFAGIKKAEDRADIIAYLRSISPNAPPLPEGN